MRLGAKRATMLPHLIWTSILQEKCYYPQMRVREMACLVHVTRHWKRRRERWSPGPFDSDFFPMDAPTHPTPKQAPSSLRDRNILTESTLQPFSSFHHLRQTSGPSTMGRGVPGLSWQPLNLNLALKAMVGYSVYEVFD
jgi:hypothetical protein